MQFILPQLSKDKTITFIHQLLVGMLGASILFIFFHILVPNKPIATVDVTHIVNDFVKSESHSKLSKSEMEIKTNNFSRALENALRQAANNQQLIIMPKEAVIAGAKDVTADVEKSVQIKLARTSP